MDVHSSVLSRPLSAPMILFLLDEQTANAPGQFPSPPLYHMHAFIPA